MRERFELEKLSTGGPHMARNDAPQPNPRRTRRDLEAENEALWDALEELKDANEKVVEKFFGDDDEEEDE
jgi:hypothetical protein